MAHPATSRLEAVQQAGELRVCIWPAYFAVSYRNPQSNRLEGIDIDLAGEFAADLGVRPTFVDTSFVAFMDELENDRCDVAMFSVGVTEERSRRVAFSAPYLCSDVYAVTTKTQRRVKIWEDIDQAGVVVAVQIGTYMEPLMRRLLKQAQILIVAPPRTREAEVRSGRADVFISDYPLYPAHAAVLRLDAGDRGTGSDLAHELCLCGQAGRSGVAGPRGRLRGCDQEGWSSGWCGSPARSVGNRRSRMLLMSRVEGRTSIGRYPQGLGPASTALPL